jgi:hypothetical protein
MLFALVSSGEVVFFLMIVIPFAIMGFRKFEKWIDPKGEIRGTTQQGILGMIRKRFRL